jgi:hypothetical protein
MTRALSLTQPWASLCVWPSGRSIAATGQLAGEKEYETRSFGCTWARNIKPQYLYIHAAKTFPAWARAMVRQIYFADVCGRHDAACASDFPVGCIIGRVRVVGSILTQNIRDRLSPQELAFGDYADGRLAIRFVDPILFTRTFPCKGALGLWRVADEVQAELALELKKFRLDPSNIKIKETSDALGLV